jgi:hypothetical protein
VLDYRLFLVTGGFGVCLLCAPQAVSAQAVVYYTYSTNSTNMVACRGFTSIHRAAWSRSDKKKDSLNVSYPVVADMDPQSPAGVAGLVNGDSIVMINRFTTLGARDPELSLWNLDVGDFNRVLLKRGDKMVDVSFHMGVWVTAPGESGGDARKVCRTSK